MRLARLLASGGGCGFVPIAPGTVASVVALLIGGILLHLSPVALATAAVLSALGGVWAIRAANIEDDPGWVVIDEFAGQFIALLGLAHITPYGLIIAFVSFRLLDILKPGPIGWADRRKGPVGVMLDDIFAGIGSAIIVWLCDWTISHF